MDKQLERLAKAPPAVRFGGLAALVVLLTAANFFFGIQPLAAVSSDLVASMVMKPVGGAVHLRRGTVNRSLVKWLVIGSVPPPTASSAARPPSE